MRVVIVGASGRMGRAIGELLRDNPDATCRRDRS